VDKHELYSGQGVDKKSYKNANGIIDSAARQRRIRK